MNRKRSSFYKITYLGFLLSWVLTGLLSFNSISQADPTDLPKLGDTVSGVVSLETEAAAGQAWLRALRARTPIISDPLLNNYLHDLIYRLASHSELENPQLTTIIVNSTAINAFAVPGGIIGVNAGLFLNAESEDEMAGVLAHELAHLSQRHFARAVERQRKTDWATMAALLASVAIIAATGGGDPGLAALATTQAAAIQSHLRFSRKNEKEADRIGMQTLVDSNFDPYAMPRFFEKLQDQFKYYGSQPPEFLLTHPVTQNRISDSKNRAAQLHPKEVKETLEFQLMRARTIVAYANDAKAIVAQYEAAVDDPNPLASAANRYGLVRAYLKAHELKSALKQIDILLDSDPYRITYVITKAEILMEQENYKDAETLLEKHFNSNPGNYPLAVYYSQALLKTKKADKAVTILERQLLDDSSNPYLWQLLSEAYGDTDNIVGVHRAKAEVQFLHNQGDEAIAQLEYALPLAKQNFQLTSKIKSRIEEIRYMMREIKI